jgi:hypothetical protein
MKVVDGKVVAETPEEELALKGLVETEVTGLKAKNAEILGKLKALDAHKDIDPDEYPQGAGGKDRRRTRFEGWRI